MKTFYFVWHEYLNRNVPVLIEHYHLKNPRCDPKFFDLWILDSGVATKVEEVDFERFLYDASILKPPIVVCPDVRGDCQKTTQLVRTFSKQIKDLPSVVLFPIQTRDVHEAADFIYFCHKIRKSTKKRFAVPYKVTTEVPEKEIVYRYAMCKFLNEDLNMNDLHLLGLYSMFEMFFPGVSSADSSMYYKNDPFLMNRKMGFAVSLDSRVDRILDFVRCQNEFGF